MRIIIESDGGEGVKTSTQAPTESVTQAIDGGAPSEILTQTIPEAQSKSAVAGTEGIDAGSPSEELVKALKDRMVEPTAVAGTDIDAGAAPSSEGEDR